MEFTVVLQYCLWTIWSFHFCGASSQVSSTALYLVLSEVDLYCLMLVFRSDPRLAHTLTHAGPSPQLSSSSSSIVCD